MQYHYHYLEVVIRVHISVIPAFKENQILKTRMNMATTTITTTATNTFNDNEDSLFSIASVPLRILTRGSKSSALGRTPNTIDTQVSIMAQPREYDQNQSD